MRTRFPAILLVLMIVAAACGDEGAATTIDPSPATSAGAPNVTVCSEDVFSETLTGWLFALEETVWLIGLTPEQAADVAESIELTDPDGSTIDVVFAVVAGACIEGQPPYSEDGPAILVTIGRHLPDQPWETISYTSVPS